LREVSGFCRCNSLCRIEIPSSVETIGDDGFYGCTSLKEVLFSSDSHFREIYGFCKCTSLCRIEIPSSVEMIWFPAFAGCTSLHVVIIRAGCRMNVNVERRRLKPFVVYEDDTVKQSRRMVHLGIAGSRKELK
jgi:hypothetical protein